jgi:hypothetical protein
MSNTEHNYVTLFPCTLQQEDKHNHILSFPTGLADTWITADHTLITIDLVLYYTRQYKISLTGDICTALLALMVVSVRQTQSCTATCKWQVWTKVRGEQQVFSGQHLPSVHYSSTTHIQIFFFPIKTVKKCWCTLSVIQYMPYNKHNFNMSNLAAKFQNVSLRCTTREQTQEAKVTGVIFLLAFVNVRKILPFVKY